MIESPSDRVPKKTPRWDLMRTEACGNEKVFLVCPLVYGQYLGIYRAKIRVRGASGGPQAWGRPLGAPSELVVSSWFFWTPSEASRVSCDPRKIIKKFHSVWTPFGIDFL